MDLQNSPCIIPHDNAYNSPYNPVNLVQGIEFAMLSLLGPNVRV